MLIPLVVAAGFAPLPGMQGMGTHWRGAEDLSQGPALPRNSHADLLELQSPPLPVFVHMGRFKDGSGEGLSKNLTFQSSWCR